MIERMWTVEDVAAFLQCEKGYVKRCRDELGLPSIKIGARLVRYHPEEVKAWALSMTARARGEE